MADQQEHVLENKNGPSLGDRLKEARQKKKLSETEVAAQLRVNKDVIVSLELQQWDSLPGRTYTRGYFASYTKFLGLPHEEMLALFNLEYSAEESEPVLKHYGSKAKNKGFPWVGSLIIVLLVAIFWFAYQEWENTLALSTNEVIIESDTTELIHLPTDEVEDNDLISEELIEAAEVEQAKINENEVDIAQGVIEKQEHETSFEATEQNELMITFSDQCWIEVTDNQSQVVLSRMMSSGSQLELTHPLPLNILIGNASATTIVLNGKEVDTKPYTQGNVAKLTLGEQS